jgi:hypothetical protein
MTIEPARAFDLGASSVFDGLSMVWFAPYQQIEPIIRAFLGSHHQL